MFDNWLCPDRIRHNGLYIYIYIHEVESNSQNDRLHFHRCLLNGKYLFWRLAKLLRKTHRHLELISNTVCINCKSNFSFIRIWNIVFRAACKHQILHFALEISFLDARDAEKSFWKQYHEEKKRLCMRA